MNNHWLKTSKKKQFYKEVDDIAMDVWSSDGTLGDLIESLNVGQLDFLMKMRLTEFMGDPDDLSFGFEVMVK